MCGIAGIWHRDGRPVDYPSLVRMTRAIAHRGPDGEGYALDAGRSLGLGHRRLAVLDTGDLGRQPMADPTGRYWISYNGEVFNFLELRGELAARGHAFRTDTDTEVILAAFAEWGADALPRFNGMWAFALWDRVACELLLARDRFGVKPLFYERVGNDVLFASERKAFLFAPGSRLAVTPPQPAAGDQFGWEGPEMLPPGHLFRIGRQHCTLTRWWVTRDHLPAVPPEYRDQVNKVREVFLDAVRVRVRSDVPLACCVSGGVDSTAVVCGLASVADGTQRRPSSWRRAYHADAPGTPQDERAFAELAIARSGAEPRWVDVVEQLRRLPATELERFAYATEGSRSVGLTPWLLYRAMRADGVVVTLDGQGADEVFGGYEFDVGSGLWNAGGYLRRPRRTWSLAHLLHNMHAARGPHFRIPLTHAVVFGDPLLRVVAGLSRRFRDILATVRRRWQVPDGYAAAEGLGAMTPLQVKLYHQVHAGHLPRLLHWFDQYSMGNGIEVRMPFLDWRVVTTGLALPEESRVGGGWTKRVVRDAAAPFAPAAVLRRPYKMGFNAPRNGWLGANRELQEWVCSTIQPGELKAVYPDSAPTVLATVERCRRDGDWSRPEAVGVLDAVIGQWVRTRWAAHGRSQVSADDPPAPLSVG